MSPKQTRNPIRNLTWALSLLFWVPAALAADPPSARDTRPSYAKSGEKRPQKAVPGRTAALPDGLRRGPAADPADASKSGARGAAAQTRPGPGGQREDRAAGQLLETARNAAAWAAERQIETRGFPEYYRAGFFTGQRDALTDDRLGAWDFREGRRFAMTDPAARRAGLDEGESAADAAAWSRAEVRVRVQFMNLDGEPRFDPDSDTPGWFPGRRDLDPPTLYDVLRDFPTAGFRFAHARPGYLGGFPIDVVRLSGCDAYTDFFVRDWDDPAAGLRAWRDTPGGSAFFRSTPDREDRERFRVEFDRAFARSLDRLGAPRLERAFHRGFDDGFDYGAFVRQELDYRRGYFEGFNAAFDRAAEEGFRRTFPRSFETAYGRLFREWSENPRPAIGEVRLVDEDDDGIFEPGERVIVETELINYGGRDGRFPIRLTGDVLASGGAEARDVLLPARSVAWDRRSVARIEDATPIRTRASVAVRLSDQSTNVALLVSRPLRFVPGSLFAARRNLDGEVLVEVEVRNDSLRPRSGSVALSTVALGDGPPRAQVPELGPGRTTTVTLTARGLPVLDLIAGDVTLDLRLETGGAEQDAVLYRVPDVTRDLGNDDLLTYVVALSRDRTASPREVARARSLFLERLREDWDRAVRGSGNPYKDDFRRGEAQTSLGELVQTVASIRGQIDNRDVFGGLSAEVSDLAGDLPGAHPFLRKYMRRLAGQLP